MKPFTKYSIRIHFSGVSRTRIKLQVVPDRVAKVQYRALAPAVGGATKAMLPLSVLQKLTGENVTHELQVLLEEHFGTAPPIARPRPGISSFLHNHVHLRQHGSSSGIEQHVVQSGSVPLEPRSRVGRKLLGRAPRDGDSQQGTPRGTSA